MAERFFSDDPLSGSNSPKLSAMQMPTDGISDDDDEEAGEARQSGTDSEDGEEGERIGGERPRTEPEAEDRNDDVQEGMLPRDLQRRTTFYDPVAERQMSQTDAKLFYQRSQLERSKTGSTSWGPRQFQSALQGTPHGSPSFSSMGMSGSVDELTHGPLPPSWNELAASPTLSASMHGGPGPGSEKGSGRDSLFLADGLRSRGSLTQMSHLVGNGHASTGQSKAPNPPETSTSHASGTALAASISAPPGIGSATYSDADVQITAELSSIFKNVQNILDLRRKYISLSLQRETDNPKDQAGWNIYPPPPEPSWIEGREKAAAASAAQTSNSVSNSMANSMVLGESSEGAASGTGTKTPKRRKPGQAIGEDFDLADLLPLPGPDENTRFRLDESGVYQVFDNEAAEAADQPAIRVPTLREFYIDLDTITTVSADGPSKSFAYRRLQYLEGKFNLYVLLNEYQETADSKRVPHRDFYNVRKVDTHVHHSACMNQKHLLRFIKSKMKKCPDEVVLFRDGKHLTLAEVFESINLTAYDLSIDTLDMHAHTDSFHRFDKFNLKYNPIGESRLRTIFLKTDNTIKGRYLAEITKEVISDLESSKYQMVEWRISIYGKSIDEWSKLAAWVVDNKLFSHNVRWLIQIPRLYDVYKATGLMDNYEQVVRNLFEPLFEVTRDPSRHPKLHVFLQRVIGLDSVDDESKVERRLWKKYPVPRDWESKQNPPYSYWIYHLYANMTSLNFWRRRRGFNTFVLRPHCGEAGDSEHLAVAALCCHSISHGLLLRKVPILQYVFYLDRIGIAMSPLSNNALFLAYERNPFHQYFKRGLNVSLSTDDPLQFAFTKEPLIEEYAVAAQIYKLSPVDMCELAKNSVKQSGYEHSVKEQWLGHDFHRPGRRGNTMAKTNVPDRREEFRFQTLTEERQMVEKYASFTLDSNGAIVAPSEASNSNNAAGSGGGPVTSAPQPGSPALSQPLGSPAFRSYTHPPATGARATGQGPPPIDLSSPSSPSASQVGGSGSGSGQTPTPISPGLILPSPLPVAAGPSGSGGGGGGGSDGSRKDSHHMSGSEPRYFPGVVARSQRRNSVRQSSWHESDDASGRSPKR